MPDIILGQELGNVGGGIGGGGAVIIIKEILSKLIFRNGKGNATKEFVGEKMDKLREEGKRNIAEALLTYPTEPQVQLMLSRQLITCNERFQQIKEAVVMALKTEFTEHRKEYREDVDRIHKRLDDIKK